MNGIRNASVEHLDWHDFLQTSRAPPRRYERLVAADAWPMAMATTCSGRGLLLVRRACLGRRHGRPPLPQRRGVRAGAEARLARAGGRAAGARRGARGVEHLFLSDFQGYLFSSDVFSRFCKGFLPPSAQDLATALESYGQVELSELLGATDMRQTRGFSPEILSLSSRSFRRSMKKPTIGYTCKYV